MYLQYSESTFAAQRLAHQPPPDETMHPSIKDTNQSQDWQQ